MAQLKANETERFIANPDFSRAVILIYGPDDGLVAERADVLAQKSGVDLSDPFSLIRLDADETAADTARLASEVHTIGMFGGKRLVRVSGTTRRDLMKAIKPVLETPPEDCIVLIEAGNLKKSAGLRKNLEASPLALCIPCYQDSDAALNQLIDEEIVAAGLGVEGDVRQLLKGMLGENRKVSRSELSKLALYCKDRDAVTVEDVYNIIGDSSQMVVEDIIDAVATGDPATLQSLLPRAFEAGNKADIILLYLLRHFQLLQMARSRVEQQRQPVSSVIGSLRPPVFFARKAAVSKAISIWQGVRLSKALTRIDQAMLDCRKSPMPGIADSLAGTTLLALALEARALSARNR